MLTQNSTRQPLSIFSSDSSIATRLAVDPDVIFHPTRECFNDAIDFFEFLVHSNVARFRLEQDRYRLVHGFIDPFDSDPFSHAWVEVQGKYVIEGKLYKGQRVWLEFDLKEYYQDAKVSDVTKYTVNQLLALNAKHNNYGPWEQKYIEQTGTERRKRLD